MRGGGRLACCWPPSSGSPGRLRGCSAASGHPPPSLLRGGTFGCKVMQRADQGASPVGHREAGFPVTVHRIGLSAPLLCSVATSIPRETRARLRSLCTLTRKHVPPRSKGAFPVGSVLRAAAVPVVAFIATIASVTRDRQGCFFPRTGTRGAFAGQEIPIKHFPFSDG